MDLADRVVALARDPTDLDGMRRRLDLLLRKEIGYDIASFSTVDPTSGLWTSCYVSGLPEDGSRDRERILFDCDIAGDVNAFAELARGLPSRVATLHRSTEGDVTRAGRWEPLLSELGVVDELRAALVAEGQLWGTVALYRAGTAQPFGPGDVRRMSTALPTIATLFRVTLLRLALAQPRLAEAPPGALTVKPDGTIHSVTVAARVWLHALDDRGRIPAVVQSVTAAARRGGLAVAAAPSRLGGIVTLHGSTVDGCDDVTVIIEAARPAVVSDVIAHAHALTPREREITGLAALGKSTREMARQLHISPFTVADHLKSVFAKVGVTSRAELVAALYHQHYERRKSDDAAPGPYSWYLDHNSV